MSRVERALACNGAFSLRPLRGLKSPLQAEACSTTL
jgi:hypothetical protein